MFDGSLFTVIAINSLRKKYPYSELFWSAFFPHFPAFGLNTEKMRTRLTPNTDALFIY